MTTAHIDTALGLDVDRLKRIGEWQDALVSQGRLPMAISLVSRHGKVAYLKASGFSDADNKIPIKEDDIFRLYSMSKPPVAMALLMLYEEGRFQLNDPVHYFLGAKWKKENMHVFKKWADRKASVYESVPCEIDITFRHLLTHTAGLSHGFDSTGKGISVDRVYALKWKRPDPKSVAPEDRSCLAAFVDGLAEMPLLYQPGTHWNYSHAPDVQGRLIEVLSGQSLDIFLASRLFGPLGMEDTSFDVPLQKVSRFTHLYGYVPLGSSEAQSRIIPLNDLSQAPSTIIAGDAAITFPHMGGFQDMGHKFDANYLNTARPKLLSAAGGLVGTVADYNRFLNFLLAGGLTPSGQRLLGVKTIEFATSNHLPEGKGLLDMILDPKAQYSETAANGGGFGLGFSVVKSPVEAGLACSTGNFAWGGAASTIFWCDPVEDMAVIFFTQVFGMQPRNMLRAKLGSFVYASICDRSLVASEIAVANARARL